MSRLRRVDWSVFIAFVMILAGLAVALAAPAGR